MAVGARIARELPVPCVALLIGDLGAGKTTFAKGAIEALGAASPDEVTSPTFTLIHEYRSGAVPVYHIDLYRLDTPAEVATLGLDDLFDQRAIVLIEWGERFPQLIPADAIRITFEQADDGDARVITRTLPSPRTSR